MRACATIALVLTATILASAQSPSRQIINDRRQPDAALQLGGEGRRLHLRRR